MNMNTQVQDQQGKEERNITKRVSILITQVNTLIQKDTLKLEVQVTQVNTLMGLSPLIQQVQGQQLIPLLQLHLRRKLS